MNPDTHGREQYDTLGMASDDGHHCHQGVDHKDIRISFEAHLTIDPHHGTELVDGFTHQAPPLTQYEIDEVLLGAHLAIAVYVMQCDYVLPYLVQMA